MRKEGDKPKRNWKKIIFAAIVFYIFLFVGIGLIMSPMLETEIVSQAVHRYSVINFSAQELADNHARSRPTVEISEDIAIPELPEIIQNLPEIDRNDIIGFVTIESVGIFLPVFYGATHVNLLAGAGTMRPNQLMGQGNFALAGHHMRDPSLLFGPLLNVREGHWIQLSNGNDVYTYRVFRTELIHQSQVDVIDDTADAIVTLFTCDVPTHGTDFRFLVQGELIDTSEIGHVNITPGIGGVAIAQGQEISTFAASFLNYRQRIVTTHEELGMYFWLLQVAGIALAADIVGMLLFLGIERKYQQIKRRNAEKFKYPV
ncbi:MAG: class A sortase [Lachnospiraceae bacterium]|nr:class A sortase [Lachnospiraceae bacterium]